MWRMGVKLLMLIKWLCVDGRCVFVYEVCLELLKMYFLHMKYLLKYFSIVKVFSIFQTISHSIHID